MKLTTNSAFSMFGVCIACIVVSFATFMYFAPNGEHPDLGMFNLGVTMFFLSAVVACIAGASKNEYINKKEQRGHRLLWIVIALIGFATITPFVKALIT